MGRNKRRRRMQNFNIFLSISDLVIRLIEAIANAARRNKK